MKKRLLISLVFSVLFLTACTDLDYYLQCASGHLEVMRSCRPIDEVLADPLTSSERRQQLEQIKSARTFASQALGLPDNGSYRQFADLGRPYVVWNVVAAPGLSLEAQQWCFPIAGCVSYRGYFDEAAARREAEGLMASGLDVDVYGVQAYSTLNWFDDPVLNTFLDDRAPRGAALIFHELAHQLLYVPDDSRFNEAFAVTVEREGVRRWLQSSAHPDEWERYRRTEARTEEFLALLNTCRQRLLEVYAKTQPDAEKLAAKQAIFSDLAREALILEKRWGGDGISRWLERGLNNARLASLATYRDLLPAFEGLLASKGGDLAAFYAAAREFGSLPAPERLARLQTFVPTGKVAQAIVAPGSPR
jgi:predicted aminopeptidase